MHIATWNLNNRVGKVPFRPEAADAAIALGADVVVFTEFYPQGHEKQFRTTLEIAGWEHQFMSLQPEVAANRVLIASKLPLSTLELDLPKFDHHFAANLLGVSLPTVGMSVLGVRIPAYSGRTANLLFPAWKWLETLAASFKSSPSIIVGDFNASVSAIASRGGGHFRRILADGWHRASPTGGPTYFSPRGHTEIDHVLATDFCNLSEASCVQQAGSFVFCGLPTAISDHAALVCRVELSPTVDRAVAG